MLAEDNHTFLAEQKHMTMSYTEHNATNADSNPETNEADSRADAFAIFFLIAIAVGAMVFLAYG